MVIMSSINSIDALKPRQFELSNYLINQELKPTNILNYAMCKTITKNSLRNIYVKYPKFPF